MSGVTRRRMMALSAGATAAVAGCGDVQSRGLQIEDMTYVTTDTGDIELTIWVENTASSTESGYLIGRVILDNGNRYRKQTHITVPSETLEPYQLFFDIDLSDSLDTDSFRYTAELEDPDE